MCGRRTLLCLSTKVGLITSFAPKDSFDSICVERFELYPFGRCDTVDTYWQS